MIGGIHRDRPGATALAAATGEPATSLGNDFWETAWLNRVIDELEATP